MSLSRELAELDIRLRIAMRDADRLERDKPRVARAVILGIIRDIRRARPKTADDVRFICQHTSDPVPSEFKGDGAPGYTFSCGSGRNAVSVRQSTRA
jgi:hypothetical protein